MAGGCGCARSFLTNLIVQRFQLGNAVFLPQFVDSDVVVLMMVFVMIVGDNQSSNMVSFRKDDGVDSLLGDERACCSPAPHAKQVILTEERAKMVD